MTERRPKKKRAESREDVEARVLPHNLEAERAVLASILINGKNLARVQQLLTPAHFFRRAHRILFDAMITLADVKHAEVDPITLRAEIDARKEWEEVGGPAYVTMLTDGVPTSINAMHYAAIVRDQHALRAVIATGTEMIDAAYDREADARLVVNEADKAIIALQRGSTVDAVDLRGAAHGLIDELNYHEQHRGELTGLDTGFASINELTEGWQPGNMILVAARPSIGKSMFTLNTAMHAAKAGKHVLVFSLEMTLREVKYRILSSLAGMPLSRVRSGYYAESDHEAMARAIGEMSAMPMFIDDRGGLTVWDIRAQCRRMRAEAGIDLVIVDYVQLVRGSLDRRGVTRNEELTDVSARLKGLARELNVPMMVVSQMNRGGDARSDKRPVLSDLRDTGALEQDADLVLFLHRKHHRESGTTNAILEKQRNGPTGTVNLTINRDTQTFTDGGEDIPPDPTPAKEKKPRPGWLYTDKGD